MASSTVRFEGNPDDPLLRAEIAKREKEQQAVEDEATADLRTESPIEPGSSEHTEAPGPEKTAVPKEDAESLERALTKQRLVRSVLSTRITTPAAETVKNRVMRAVLRGDTEELAEAIKRKRLKGVAIALTADDRQRTALHMAAGTGNVQMVRALMQWRRELNRSLRDDLDSLDDRRDMFVDRAISSSANGGGAATVEITKYDIDHFEAWLSEERRRLVRVTELRCEECWRRSVTARDDKEMTPLHWAVIVNRTDNTLVQTLLTTGRASLSAKDASSGPDRAVFAALRTEIRRASSNKANPTSTACDSFSKREAADNDTATTPPVFPRDGEFHRRTGKIRRQKIRSKRCKAQAKGKEEEDGRGVYSGGGSKEGSGWRQGPDGLTATTGKVEWFCGALAKTAERLSGRTRGGAEAFLLSVFEDFDRTGQGTLSMRQFREVLHDVNITVSEQTLLEVGRFFQAPTAKSRQSQHKAERHQSRYGDAGRSRDEDGIGIAPLEMSYVPLMDIAFGRKEVREPSRGVRSEGKAVADEGLDRWEKESSSARGRAKMASDPPDACYRGENHDHYYYYDDDDDGDDDDDRCYVNVDRIRAARVAVIEMADALGRPPLFLAAAADALPAVKTLIRHGAASNLAVDGTGLTPHAVAPSLLVKRLLAVEARQSLCDAISARTNGHYLCGYLPGGEGDRKGQERTSRHETAESEGQLSSGSPLVDESKTDDIRRMEMWAATLAEDEVASAGSRETRVDQKTSLHLAAAAGLPESVKDLLRRGVGDGEGGTRRKTDGRGTIGAALTHSRWKTSWKPSDQGVGDTLLNTAAHCAHEHQEFRQDVSSMTTLATDANGWSALHACCAECSSRHFSCALALLGSERDPNARTNTGKTPLHVAASSVGWGEVRGGGDLISLLVSHGADLEAKDDEGLRPIHFAAKAGRHTALLALLTAGADPWSKTPRAWNALHFSVVGQHVGTTRLLAYWDSDSGAFGGQQNCKGVTPADLGRTNEIHSAASTIWESAALGEVERVSSGCLESSRSPKDTTGKPWGCPGVNSKSPGLGFTPLHACMAGLAAVTRGEDVGRPCTPPRPLAQANHAPRPSLYARLALGCRRQAVRLGSGASSTARRRLFPARPANGKERTVAATERRSDYVGVCRALLAAGADVHALDARSRTPLALAAAAGSSEVVEMLLGAGADPRACDADGNTPLHFAFAYANAAVAATLSKEGADEEERNRSSKTPQDVGGLCSSLATDGNEGDDSS